MARRPTRRPAARRRAAPKASVRSVSRHAGSLRSAVKSGTAKLAARPKPRLSGTVGKINRVRSRRGPRI